MQNISPFLWFKGNAEEAVNLYMSVFRNSKINRVSRYSEAGPEPPGTVMTIDFELDGTNFIAMNAQGESEFTHAISFSVGCKTQAEIDEYWDGLVEGGQAIQCGWLTDKFGVSWQIVPVDIVDWVGGPDPAGAARAAEAMFGMVKLEIEGLRKAYEVK